MTQRQELVRLGVAPVRAAREHLSADQMQSFRAARAAGLCPVSALGEACKD